MKGFPIDKTYQKRIIQLGCHEAGHYRVARVLGFETGSIKFNFLDSNGAHTCKTGIKLTKKLNSIEDVLLYSKERVQVLYAGACRVFV